MYQNKPWRHFSACLVWLQLGCGAQPAVSPDDTAVSSAPTKPSVPKSYLTSPLEHPDDAFTAGPHEEVDRSREVWELEFSRDGAKLATAGIEGAFIWDTRTGAKLSEANSDGLLIEAELSPDGALFFARGCASAAALWDADSGARLFSLGGEADSFVDLDFSPDGARLAGTLLDGATIVWDNTGKQLLRLEQQNPEEAVVSVVFSQDGRRLFTQSESAVLLWDTKSGERLKSLFQRPVVVYQAVSSVDGARLVTLSRYIDVTLDDEWRSEVMLWDVSTGALLGTVPMKHRTQRAELSPDGTRLAVVTASGRAEILDVKTAAKLFDSTALIGRGYGPSFEVEATRFSPDGALLAVGYVDGTVQFWDMKTQSVYRSFKAHTHELSAVKFSPDGETLATAGLDGVRLWSVETGALRYEIEPADKPAEVKPTMAAVGVPPAKKL